MRISSSNVLYVTVGNMCAVVTLHSYKRTGSTNFIEIAASLTGKKQP